MTTSNFPLDCIVLIDDDEITNLINERVINSVQIANTITALRNGKEGIGFLKKYYEEHSVLPELIFLDLNMPLMDGFEFMEEFNRSEFKATSVIVVLTTSENPRDIGRLEELGIKYVFSKPLTFERLTELVSKEPLLNQSSGIADNT